LGCQKKLVYHPHNQNYSYINPKKFNGKCLLNEKSDIYSIGVLLWEISSGKPPFHDKEYDTHLAIQISNGLIEDPTLDTPKDYVRIYNGKQIKLVYKILFQFIKKLLLNYYFF